MVKVRGRNSNGKTVKQTAEKLARASICDVMVPLWCHLAIMARSRDWIQIFVISRNQPVSSDDMMLTRRWLRSSSRSSSWRSPVMMLRTLTRCHRNFSQLSGVLVAASCRQVSIVTDCSNDVFSSINRLRWTVKSMLSLLSNFWNRMIRTKAQLPRLSARTTLFMCSWLLAHRCQTAKKKDHPNLLPVLEVALEQRTAMHRVWVALFADIYQESEDNIELLPLYQVPCVTLCTLSPSCQRTLTKRQKKKKKKKKKIVRCQCTTKLTQVSSFSESHASHGRARHQIWDWSESGRSRELLTPGISDSCRPRGVVTRDFSAIFGRLFDRLPVRISTSDLHHWILRKKIFHIRAYDFGVQFSFKCWYGNGQA